jgi:hypothetical protein
MRALYYFIVFLVLQGHSEGDSGKSPVGEQRNIGSFAGLELKIKHKNSPSMFSYSLTFYTSIYIITVLIYSFSNICPWYR